MSVFTRVALCLVSLICLVCSAAQAHRIGESYVYFSLAPDQLTGRFEVQLNDLNRLLPLDTDGDGLVTEAEYLAAGDAIFAELAPRLTVKNADRLLRILPDGFKTLETKQGVFAQVQFAFFGLSDMPRSIEMTYDPVDTGGPARLGYAIIENNYLTGVHDNEAYISLAFNGSDQTLQTLNFFGEPPHKAFLDYLRFGVLHVLLDLDHPIFLLVLILGVMLRHTETGWQTTPSLRSSVGEVAFLIGAASLANVIAMTLGALGVISLDVLLANILLAALILTAVAVVLVMRLPGLLLWVSIAIGGVHGIGFAGLAAPLGTGGVSLLFGLLGFGVGMFLGWIALSVIPILLVWGLGHFPKFSSWAIWIGSAIVIGVTLLWILEEATSFDLNIRAILRGVTGTGG